MRTKYKQWAVDYLKEGKNILSLENKEDILSFINEKETFLEIGPGKGQFILGLASRYPEINFLVVELNATVAGIALKKIDESELNNVKLIQGDFYNLVDIINEKSIEGIFLNFSDPWPKKRHERRRLTSDNFLKAYIKILKDDHKIYYKSDNFDFYTFSKEKFIEFGFDVLEDLNDYKIIEEFDEETEFEKKYKENGIKINRLILKKGKNIKYE